jgi:DNA gyrase inhibitor GyrI
VSFLKVDPAVLRATGQRLSAAVEVARDVRREGGTVAVLVTDAGHEQLTDTVQTFFDKWSHGIGCLIEDAETLATMLTDAGTTYGQVESAVARACEPGG